MCRFRSFSQLRRKRWRVCFCQCLAATISARVTPLARLIRAMTSAFLLLRSAAGLWPPFVVRWAADLWAALFVVLAFFIGWAVLVIFFSLLTASLGGASAARWS